MRIELTTSRLTVERANQLPDIISYFFLNVKVDHLRHEAFELWRSQYLE